MRFLILLIIPFHLWGQLTAIRSFEELLPIIANTDSKTLVVFDIDDVLVQPKNPVLQAHTIYEYYKHFEEITQDLNSSQMQVLFAYRTSQYPLELVDLRLPPSIQKLQEKRIQVIALSAFITGDLFGINSIEEKRIEDLKKLGIDFSTTYGKMPPIIFSNFPSFNHSYPMFKQGILFTNGVDHHDSIKGNVLISFLWQLGTLPKEIIFIDDRIENVENVCYALSVAFPSIRFTGILFDHTQERVSKKVSAAKFKKTWQQIKKRALQETTSH